MLNRNQWFSLFLLNGYFAILIFRAVKFMVSFKRMVRIVENDENFSIVNLIFKAFIFCSVMLNKLIIKCVRPC